MEETAPRKKLPTLQLGVARSTVYRQMRKENVVHEKHTDLDDTQLTEIISEIKGRHPESGEVMVTGHLRQQGIFVQRSRLRKILMDLDPEGIQRRRNQAIKRRVYSVPCPHYLWHIDGNHKLIKWKFVIHGSIDGFTRLITFLKISDNNRASTVFSEFQRAAQEFQRPLHIRTDHGGENQQLWNDMIATRGAHSVIVGSSVHNERIERLWRDVTEKVTGKYRTLFHEMNEEENLNPDNELDILCLHWVFTQCIQRDLSEFAAAHNQHGISTENSFSPLQLYAMKKHLTELHEESPDEAEEESMHLPQELPHVQCAVQATFCPQLKQDLERVELPSKMEEAYGIYMQVSNIVGQFMTENGHF